MNEENSQSQPLLDQETTEQKGELEDKARLYSRKELKDVPMKDFSWSLEHLNPNQVAFSEGSISEPKHVEALSLYLESGSNVKSFALNGAFTGRAQSSYKKLLHRLLTRQCENLLELSLQNEMVLDSVVCKDINAWLKSKGLVFKFTGTLSEENFNLMFEDSQTRLKFTCLKLGEVTIRTGFFNKLTALLELSLNNTPMEDDVWKAFCDFIRESKSMKSFTFARILHNNMIRAVSLGQVLGRNKNLKTLQIIHEQPKVVAQLIKKLEGNKSLENLTYNSLHDKNDSCLTDVVDAFTKLLKEDQSELMSISVAGIVLPVEVVILLNKNIIKRQNTVKAQMDNIVNELNRDARILALEFKSWVYGSGTRIFFDLLPQYSANTDIDLNFRVAASYDSLLLRGQDMVGNKSSQFKAIPQLLPVDVCNSGQQNAYSIFSSFSSKQIRDTTGETTIKQEDLAKYFAQNGVEIANGVNVPVEWSRVQNCWFGLEPTDIGTPFLRSRHDGEICLVTFMLEELLTPKYNEEMKKVTSIIAKVPDSHTVFLVGIIKKSVVSSRAETLGFDLSSLKRFVSQELMEVLPLNLQKKIGKRSLIDRNERDETMNSIFYVDSPFDNTFTDDQCPLWRSIQEKIIEKQVPSKWYVLLAELKTKGSYIWYEEASELLAADKHSDLDRMMRHFESSGELLVLEGDKEHSPTKKVDQLIVLDKSWLKKHLEDLSSGGLETSYADLWPDKTEDEGIRSILRKYAITNGILFEIGSNKRSFLPYVVPKPGTEVSPTNVKQASAETQEPLVIADTSSAKAKDSSSNPKDVSTKSKKISKKEQEASKKAKDSSSFFSIFIPHHYGCLEFFNIFCGNLLNCAIGDTETIDEKSFVRSSDYLEFSFKEVSSVWAKCDIWKSGIQLGFVEENLTCLEAYITTCHDALRNTVLFFTPNLGTDELFDIKNEDLRTIKQYPHLLLHFVIDDEIMKIPYEAISGKGSPREFGVSRLPAKTILDVDFEQLAKDLSAKALEPELTDVVVMSSGNKESHPDQKDFFAWLLRHRGYRVEFEGFSEEICPPSKSKVLVVFLEEEILSSLESDDELWYQRAEFRGWPIERCFFIGLLENLTRRCNRLFVDCRSLHDENPGTVLKTLLTDVSKKVNETS